VNIVLFGPPGAGKGTQADNLTKDLKLVKVSTGELLREEIKKKYNNNLKVNTKRSAKNLDDEILKLNNLNIVTLDHKELEFLRSRNLLEKSLIRPIYLS